jgi:membrane-bound ClpP family serine protease
MTTRRAALRFADAATVRRTRRWRLWLTLCVVGLGTAGRGLVERATAQAPVVYVIPIEGVIDLGLAPLRMGAPGGAAQPVEEKTVSYLRKEFRATAEARKRPPLIAEAMVDADVEVPGLSDKGKRLP